jgi:hypothetical protein
MAESQLSELQNMRVILEEARGLSRNLAYHSRARLETKIGAVLDEVDQQIEELRAAGEACPGGRGWMRGIGIGRRDSLSEGTYWLVLSDPEEEFVGRRCHFHAGFA